MSGKKCALGVAILTTLAVSVATAPTAAANYNSEVSTWYIVGTPLTTTPITTNGGTIKCAIDLEATVSATSQSKISLQLEFTPAPVCTAYGLKAEINTSGCSYEFGEPTVTSGTGWHAGIKVLCPASPTTVNVPGGPCEVTIGAQTPGGVMHLMNTGSGSTRAVEVDAAISGITYTSSGGACGSSGTNGTLTGKWLLKAYKDEAHTQQVAFFIS